MASTSDARAPFVVTGQRRNGSVTYRCPTAEWAWRKWNDFTQAGYTAIAATGADGRALDEAALRAAARSKAAEPIDG